MSPPAQFKAQSDPMESQDHRPRVAAQRRKRMRSLLLSSTLQLVAEKGPSSTSIDDVIAAAGVSRGTFYKYFPSPEALVQELALEVAKDLVFLADPVVRQRDDPAERVSCGIRLVCRLALHHPAAAAFLVRLGWPDTQGPNLLLDFVRRDVEEAMKRGRFRTIPLPLALNMVSGAVIGAIHCMLKPGCEQDFAEMTAAVTLRALGVAGKTADALAYKPLASIDAFPQGLLSVTSPASGGARRGKAGPPNGRGQNKPPSDRRARTG
ncbi:TetR/AcrR family transcriptional regulator [Dyella soli]|uniref:TetR/AcrR family transcriptional regulator n=1 Tax=Dyella soli TaxID=522319 RepID=A0A4R0YXE4_9GAMM|nr:TetR/AcrR family transcriptional regulator [Dyella soli]